MLPTLQNGQHIFVLKLWFNKTEDIKRFDIVIFEKHNKRIIKRVIGLPGEIVKIIMGNIFINGTKIAQNFKFIQGTCSRSSVKLMEDEYFVMGDNRPNSFDSRHIGPIKIYDIKYSMRIPDDD